MSKRKKQIANAEGQLNLALTGDTFAGPAETNGVFSLAYLLRQLEQSPSFAAQSDAAVAYELVCRLYRQHGVALKRQNEAFTCSTFLEPVLDSLGWHRIPQQSMPSSMETRKRPDYCLVTTEQAFMEASRADAVKLFQLSATVLEAKKWGHPLDRMSSGETPGWFPSQQIQDYLNHAKDATGHRFFDWAILTNGDEWRLYCEQSAVGAYFSFHLVRDGQLCTEDEFRLFFTLFRAAAFDRSPEGLCFLDSVREQSLRAQGELELNLRKRIFGVLEDLGTAFANREENGLHEADYPKVYEVSLVFLYRLLFVLYAESRGLLPVREYGAGANRRYLNDFSLARLAGKLRDSSHYQDNAFCQLYEELLHLFELINGTFPSRNASLKVTRYNGGLFSPRAHEEIGRWRIGDRDLADILRQLIYVQPPARSREAQRQISTREAIDYSTLEVRQLGDIYEGLLGAHFEKVEDRLELRNENGENHRSGIFYTPDWIVQFLVNETLLPLLSEIERSPDVQRALQARSEERKRDNSFAFGVLNLNLVDPAMGSGHFLVRATEWLADHIMSHPTTQPMTMQIIGQGQGQISREEIIARGKIPVAPGISQEQAEKAYWRRRVVEACIHGVDVNPMAVELAKLSLWLTCIAADEPLNFLDHHLRKGNALLSVAPDELKLAPDGQETFDLGERLHDVLSGIIRDTLAIERQPSTEMEAVKEKERLWKDLRLRLKPFLDLSDLWISMLDGVPLVEMEYLSVARLLLGDQTLTGPEKRDAKRRLDSMAVALESKKADLMPFHWRLEFPDVFYDESGEESPPNRCGFDAILGNPPYVSIHTAKEIGNRKMRDALEKRAGYLEDLYVHFTDLGFQLLRKGGGFGFIVSDTFFTLASKLRMREILQRNSLDWLGQCDPFDATVDAAVFVARKKVPEANHRFRFVQARPRKRPDGTRTVPDENLEKLSPTNALAWNEPATLTPFGDVFHATVAELRLHEVPLSLHAAAHKKVFFEPRPGTLHLFDRFNGKVKELVAEWWEKIEDSREFSANLPEIQAYHRTLRPGDISLVGLVAEGGQGLATANNARFLAYLDGTPQAEEIKEKSQAWSASWLASERVGPAFRELLQQAGGDASHPTANRPAWEAAVHGLRERFTPAQLGLGRTFLFRVAPPDLVAGAEDFAYSFQRRKAELLVHWQGRSEFMGFWDDKMEIGGNFVAHSDCRKAKTISDADFCELCQHLQLWVRHENAVRKPAQRIPKEAVGLRSSEDYSDPADAPRIATIYNGLYGRAQYVPFRKGDSEGNRWLDDDPLCICWTNDSVRFLFDNSGKNAAQMPVVRNPHLYFTTGVSWTRVANHVAVKARLQPHCVFDSDAVRLTPMKYTMSAVVFMAIFNSDVFSYMKMRFHQHTAKWEIGNLRQMPIVMPNKKQHAALAELATLAMAAKRHEFAGSTPANDFISRVREIGERLRTDGPSYLRPSAQGLLLAGPGDCLEVIERAVNWEAEKLYGVEGLGPFDEF